MTIMARENHTPIRTVRVEKELWAQVRRKAAAEGRTVSGVIREGLIRYVNKKGRK